jgi:hypothetical protein
MLWKTSAIRQGNKSYYTTSMITREKFRFLDIVLIKLHQLKFFFKILK